VNDHAPSIGATHASPPPICVEAPVRLDLAGGWTDVPPFVDNDGGLVINAAIDRHVHVEITRRPSGILLSAEDLDERLEVAAVADLAPTGVLALLQAAVMQFVPEGGVELRTRTDAPQGSGLGTSGALATALAFACHRLHGNDIAPEEAARLGWQLEVGHCGLAGGRQDQYAAALGGINLLDFSKDGVEATTVTVPPEVRARLEDHLVLCYVGESRISGDTITRVMNAYSDRVDRVVRALKEMKDLARRMAQALPNGDLEHIGHLVARNWECQMTLDEGMQTDAMRQVEAAVSDAGGLGGKAVGAGAGGCMVFVAGGDPQAVKRAAINAGAMVLPLHLEWVGVHQC
jgi:D-glycero-alpha-D-manno-heptose-7-phosphate kinase